MIQLMSARRVLGVNCWASKRDIRRAAIQKAQLLQPALIAGPKRKMKDASDRLATILNAYKLLKNFDSPAQVIDLKYKPFGRGRRQRKMVALVLVSNPAAKLEATNA